MDNFKKIDTLLDSEKYKQKKGANVGESERNNDNKQLPISSELLDRDLIARNEFNLEKWSSFIFPHARTKDLDKARTLTYNPEDKNGKQSITITPIVGHRSYTARTYKTLLAVIIWWYKHPSSDGTWSFHLSDIAKIKGISTKGKNLDNIHDDLDCLDATLMKWQSLFLDESGTPKSFRNIHIITEYSGKSGEKNRANRRVSGRFSRPFLNNLIAGKTNPQNLTSLMKIKGEIAQIIFRYIDTKTYKRTRYEKNSRALFNELGLINDAPKYKEKGKRIALLERVIKEIDQLILSTGNVLRIKLEKANGGKDVKIVCHNIPANYLPSDNGKRKAVHTAKNDINGYSEMMLEVVKIDDENFISWTRTLAKYYDKETIFKVVGDFKEMDRHGDIEMENRGAVFTNYFHRTAHQRGLEWIGKDCDKNCPLRPENQQQQELV